MLLRQYLDSENLSDTAFGRMLGVSHSTVARWAAGALMPTRDRLRLIAEATRHRVLPNDFVALDSPVVASSAAPEPSARIDADRDTAEASGPPSGSRVTPGGFR